MYLHTLRFDNEETARTVLADYRNPDGWDNSVCVQRVVIRDKNFDASDENAVPKDWVDDRFIVSIALPVVAADLTAMPQCRMVREWHNKALAYEAFDFNPNTYADTILEPLPFGFGSGKPAAPVRVATIYESAPAPAPAPAPQPVTATAEPVPVVYTAPVDDGMSLRVAMLGIRANSMIANGVSRGDYRWHKDGAIEDFEWNGALMDAQDFIDWAATQI